MAPSQAAERRRSARVDQVDLVQVRRLDQRGSLDLTTGRTVNISRGGLRFELCHHIPVRSAISLTLALGEQFLTVDGTVVYLEPLGGSRCQVGVRFTDLDARSSRTLDEFMARYEARPAEAVGS